MLIFFTSSCPKYLVPPVSSNLMAFYIQTSSHLQQFNLVAPQSAERWYAAAWKQLKVGNLSAELENVKSYPKIKLAKWQLSSTIINYLLYMIYLYMPCSIFVHFWPTGMLGCSKAQVGVRWDAPSTSLSSVNIPRSSQLNPWKNGQKKTTKTRELPIIHADMQTYWIN